MTDDDTGAGRAPDRPLRRDALAAVHELRVAMRQADLGSADLLDDGETCAISAEDAIDLARLVRNGMLEVFDAATDLATCLRAHGLEMEEPYVTRNKINLGMVSVPVAAQLAIALGAPQDQVKTEHDPSNHLSRWAYADHVGDLLRAAFHQTTGCVLVDYLFHAECLRCSSEAAIELGHIEVAAAQRMADALQCGL
ncbi:hypothetical protein [Streptomyces sp. NPDC007063]|uniref:hypothetical protein n=1 Tax=Streptomyces sp. NPDC007063 TaxID=3364772 RepID=UPI00368BD84F